MPTTTPKTILQTLRAGLATNPTDPAILQALRQERRRLMSYDPATVGADQADDLSRAFGVIKLSASAVLALGEAQVNAALAVLAEAYPALPADDPAANVIDQKKIRLKTRALLTDALLLTAPAEQWLATRVEDFKRRQLRDYQATDPCEAKFTTLLAQVATPTDPAQVRAAIMTLQNMWHLLEPVAP